MRTLPRDDRDLFIAASNAHVMALDNVSGIPPWTSDSLCRLSTGGGFATRELYTDCEEKLFDATRPIAITSIQDVVTYSDLADRTIMLTLPLIRDDRRLTETQIWSEFDAMHSAVLGALLDAVVHGLRNQTNVVLKKMPRMADFAVWATACEPALGLRCSFAEAYAGNRDQARETVVAADLVADTLRTFMRKKQKWTGTAAPLLSALGQCAGDSIRYERTWPSHPNKLSGRLRKAAAFLREDGLEIVFGPGRVITITNTNLASGEIVFGDTSDEGLKAENLPF